jgi:hypothetical protein
MFSSPLLLTPLPRLSLPPAPLPGAPPRPHPRRQGRPAPLHRRGQPPRHPLLGGRRGPPPGPHAGGLPRRLPRVAAERRRPLHRQPALGDLTSCRAPGACLRAAAVAAGQALRIMTNITPTFQKYGEKLDLESNREISSAIKGMPGSIARTPGWWSCFIRSLLSGLRTRRCFYPSGSKRNSP